MLNIETLLLPVVVVVACVGFMRGRLRREDKVVISPRPRTQTHAVRSGWLAGFGAFELISLNSGKTWFSVDRDGTSIVPANGRLVEQLDALDVVSAACNKARPKGGSEGVHLDLGTLEKAGFVLSDRTTRA